MKNNNNERGVALIAAVMITAVLAGIGISFVFNMRLEEKAAANYLWKTQADAIAQGGIERAIQTIVTYRNEQHTFIGTPGGTVTAGGTVRVADPSRYEFLPLEVPLVDFPHGVTLGDRLIARSEIVVRDEAGKVNINTSGHPEILTGNTGFARSGIDRGWTTAEIKLPLVGIEDTVWRRKFGPVAGGRQEGASGVDDNRLLADGTTINTFGADYISGPPRGLSEDGIDNDGDGTVDEANEGVDEHSEFRFLEGGRITLDAADVGDDRPFITLGETEISGDISLHTTLYSRDRFTDRDVWLNIVGAPGAAPGDGIDNDGDGLIDEAGEVEWRPKIDINTASVTALRDVLVATLGATVDAEQVALNIIDFRDADSIPSFVSGWNRPGTTIPKRGIERTLFINEIREEEYIGLCDGGCGWWCIGICPEYRHEVDEIELHNPWNTPVSGRYRVRWTDATGPSVRTIFNEWIEIPPFGFRYFYHNPLSDSESGGSIMLERCRVGNGTAFEIVETISIIWRETTSYHAKNDPRVPRFTYVGTYHSFNDVNNRERQGFNPEANGEVSLDSAGNPFPHAWKGHFNHFRVHNSPGGRNFHNTGELGYIHTGEQWSTLRMRNVERPGGATTLPHQGAVLNRVTIGHPYNRMGRININTALEPVLGTLPQMSIQPHQVNNIITRREGAGVPNPFNTIGDAVPHLTARSLPPVVDDTITELMDWLQNFANDVIHWPRTWGWPLGGIGRDLHNWIIDALQGTPLVSHPINLTIPYDTTPPFQYTIGGITHTSNRPIYFNPFQNPLITSLVEGISRNVVNVVRSAINTLHDWSNDWWNSWLRPFINEWIINPYLNPILDAGNTLHSWSLTGDNLDEDGFFEGVNFRGFNRDDDEREAIVRSVSNLITTRSDRFEIISTGSVLREGAADPLAVSEMRVVVCRISNPVTILHFERR